MESYKWLLQNNNKGLPEEEQKIVLDVIEYLVIFPNRQLATKIKKN